MAEITVTDTEQRPSTARILDVREDFEVAEVAEGTIPGALHIPMGQLQARVSEFDPAFRSSPSATAATAAPASPPPSTPQASPPTLWPAA
jgi:rhodanese-related sulfurtransferase